MKNTFSALVRAVSLLVIGGVLLLGVWWYPSPLARALALSCVILGGTELVFRVIIFRLLEKRVHTSITRYGLNKTLTFLQFAIAILLILAVWLPNTSTVFATYGFVAAAIAFAIQDLFKDLIGGIVIVLRNLYRVGDRVEVDGMVGDVIDIGLLYTTLLEVGGWGDSNQPTGRMIRMPNGKVITNNVCNYTADHAYLWDEVRFILTSDSHWQTADRVLREVLEDTTQQLSAGAMQELREQPDRYGFATQSTESQVYLETTAGTLALVGRFPVEARQRPVVRDAITRAFLEQIAREKHIHFG